MKLGRLLTSMVLLFSLASCTTIGTGHRTVIRAKCQVDPARLSEGVDREATQLTLCGYLSSRYPHLVVPPDTADEALVLRVDPDGEPEEPSAPSFPSVKPTYPQFLDFVRLKYGRPDFRSIDLSFKVHDRSITPAFLRSDVRSTLTSTLAGFFTTNPDLDIEKKIELQELAEARLRNAPDLAATTAVHHVELCGAECRSDFLDCMVECRLGCCGKPEKECQDSCADECSVTGRVYYYYPRISVDFSSSFLSTSAPDRLSYLAAVVRLKEDVTSSELPVRFIDFYPKDADLVEFSRGDLTDKIDVTASANLGGKETGALTTGAAPLVKASTSESTLGASTGITFSETLATKLVDSIEKKTTGILEQGRTFFADLRSIRQIRVAGTYNFDLMLEVPATPQFKNPNFLSIPVEDKVLADVFLIGVVRHVYQRGRIGRWHQAPESENDHVYEQVLLEVLPNRILWTSSLPWGDPIEIPASKCEIKVLTNRDDASFVVVDEKGAILANGKGRESTLSYAPRPNDAEERPQEAAGCYRRRTCGKIGIKFLSVVVASEKSGLEVLAAQDLKDIVVEIDKTHTIQASYEPKR